MLAELCGTAQFSFEVSADLMPNLPASESACLRLFDLTAGQPIAGSLLCLVNPVGSWVGTRVRSGAFTLPSAQHEYVVETMTADGFGAGQVENARIIVDW